MFTTTPPRPGGQASLAGWGLARAVRLAFDQPALLNQDAGHADRLRIYLTDMLQPYHLELEPGGIERAAGQSYGEMAQAVIGRLVGTDEPVDFLVLAFAVPDITPGRATATWLSHICPGNPLAMAVVDQGTAAAFTGLRLIRDFVRTGGGRRGLLVVVEQSDLPYRTTLPTQLPGRHAAVALLFDDSAAEPNRRLAVTELRTRTEVAPSEVSAALTDGIAALAGEPALTRVLLGPALAGHATELSAFAGVRASNPAQPYTGLWWELAGEPAEVPSGDIAARRLVLADYDRQLGYLSLATLDPAPLATTAADPVASDPAACDPAACDEARPAVAETAFGPTTDPRLPVG